MRVFLTGGTGFIGGWVARKLRERGDDVVVLARSPDRASELVGLGCEVVAGDLSDTDAIRRGVQGCDAVIHGAAIFKIGIPKSERPAMWEANVGGTERVLDAAIEAGTPKIVYLSTVMVYGNTHGEHRDDSYERPAYQEFESCYEETKHASHQAALGRIGAGAPIVIVQPCAVYGPGDKSDLAGQIDQASTGKLPAKVFPETGGSFVHVEDVAGGILLALDRGEPGESYILGGEVSTLGQVLDRVAAMSGQKPAKLTVPPAVFAAVAPLGPVLGPRMGLPPNLREVMRAWHGTTYWFNHDKARERLGYSPRGLDDGLRDTLENRRLTVRVFLTGGTGFIGGHVARLLRERGDDVVALVRSPEKAGTLRGARLRARRGRPLRRGRDPPRRRGSRRRHPRARRSTRSACRSRRARSCWNANVHGTERVLDAAIEAGHAADRLRLHGQRLRQHQRRGGRRDLRAPRGRRLPLGVRRDQVPLPPDRRGAASRPAPRS